MAAGAAVIDSLESPIAGHRIEPLPLPAQAAERIAASIVRIRSDGAVDGAACQINGLDAAA